MKRGKKSRTILVDLEVEVEGETGYVDYRELARICELCAEKGPYLLEDYAREVLEKIFEKFPLKKGKILVKKPEALKERALYTFVRMEKEK